MTCRISYNIVLILRCIRNQRDMGDWCSVTVIKFLWFTRLCDSSPTVTFESSMFVVCDLDTDLV